MTDAMDQLGRIVVLHPAGLPKDYAVTVLDSSVSGGADSRRAARRAAATFLASGSAVGHPGELWQATVAVAVHDLLQAGPRSLAEVERLVCAVSGRPLAGVAGAASLAASRLRLADTLVAVELVGDAGGRDVRTLAAAAQGYDVLQRAGAGQDPVGLRPLAMPSLEVGLPAVGRVAS